MSKIDVNGENADPVYSWLRRNSDFWCEQKKVAKMCPWNFTKFIVDRNGTVVKTGLQKDFPEDLKPTILELLEN